jgi:type I restriction enzyme S subunit
LLSDKTLRLVLDEGRICPDYLVQVLRMPEARAHIERNATGTSDSMRNISQEALRATPIPLPALAIQINLAKRLQEAEICLNDIRLTVAGALADIELLPSRLLAQAFAEI